MTEESDVQNDSPPSLDDQGLTCISYLYNSAVNSCLSFPPSIYRGGGESNIMILQSWELLV